MSRVQPPKPELIAPIIAGFVAAVTGWAATLGLAISAFVALGATREQTVTAVCALHFG